LVIGPPKPKPFDLTCKSKGRLKALFSSAAGNVFDDPIGEHLAKPPNRI
jgi:hypothetical protein